MAKNENYRNFDNRTTYNGCPCRPDYELVPVVLNKEKRIALEKDGLKEEYLETWTFGTKKVPVAFMSVTKGQKEEYFEEIFNKDVKRFITKNAEDLSGLPSLDEILNKVDRKSVV